MNSIRICLLLPFIAALSFAEDPPANATQAAERVILPKVDFREASLEEAAEFLTHVGRKYAKDPTRLNIILAVPLPAGPPVGALPDPRPKITLQKQSQSLLTTLQEAAAQAGCEVQGEAHALVVRAKGAPALPPVVLGAGANGEAIRKKLDQIVVPRIDFRQSTPREGIEFLVLKMKQLDPNGAGVSVVMKVEDQGPAGIPVAAPPGIPGLPAGAAAPNPRATALVPAAEPPKIPGLPGLPAGEQPAPIIGHEMRISMQVTNMPILELFRYIAGLADLQVTIEDFAVVIAQPRKK